MIWAEAGVAEQEMGLDTVSVGGTLLCLKPVSLPCLINTQINKKKETTGTSWGAPDDI